ncbi:MAG: sodium ion-translocating decarboxylase subunit beta, partial [Clostridia bacterium]|nr:sodium ion-translocating decarboxylase subunit beta [Clostridia bacterium]
MDIGKTLSNLWETSGLANFTWQNIVMIVIACVFLYLGIKKQFEPLLLVGIAFGMLLTNLPMLDSDALYHPEIWTG